MSSNINPDVPPGIRCEAIPPSSTSHNLVCHRAHGTVLRYPGSGAGRPTGDDPAHLIGLALDHVRQGTGLTGLVPDTVIGRLQAHADTGNPACRLLLDWLSSRNRDLAVSAQPDAGSPGSAKLRPLRRLIRERRRARPGSLKKRWPMKAQPSNGETAIIAAMTEGRIDE